MLGNLHVRFGVGGGVKFPALHHVSYKSADDLTIENDDLPEDELREFLSKAFIAAAKVMKPGSAMYIWHADRLTEAFRSACRTAGMDVRQGLVWVKNALVLGRSDYQWRHEPVLYGWLSGAPHRWFGDRKQTTVLEFDKPSKNEGHPTVKPTALFELQIRNSCPPGGLVLDLFAGSGTTALAAERAGRRAKLMEISPAYCDVIRKRYATFVNGEGCDWIAATPPATAIDGGRLAPDKHAEGAAGEDAAAAEIHGQVAPVSP